MKAFKIIGLFMFLMVALVINPSIAQAAPPPPVGLTPVSQDAVSNFGSLVGENGSSHAGCTANGIDLLVTTGDFTAYKEPDGSVHTANRAVVINADTGAFVWGLSSVNGWIHTSACANGRIYFGGTFTSFQGVSRTRTAAISATTFQLAQWHVPYTGTVWDIEPGDGDMIVAGSKTVTRVNEIVGTTVWSRAFDCGVRTVRPVGTRVYAGGFFDNIIRPGTTPQAARGLAALSIATGAPLADQPTGSISNTLNCNEPGGTPAQYFNGANPLSLAYDAQRGNVISCEGGIRNVVRSVDVTTGDNNWSRFLDGDGQVCVVVKGYVFAGFHRSGGNVGVYTNNWGNNGAIFNGSTGAQAIWEPNHDFEGNGANRDGRNNGIIGAVYFNNRLYVTGGFDSVDGFAKPKMASFAVDPGQ